MKNPQRKKILSPIPVNAHGASDTRFGSQEFIVLSVAAAIVLVLFVFGLSYPFEMRVRGDAAAYLLIASKLEGFRSIFQYAGDRTIGFPYFEFLILKALGPPDFSNHYVLQWANIVGVALLITHVVTAWLFSQWIRRSNLVKSRFASLALFLFLATYPAFIGYTTSPLTDTFTIDLILCAVVLLDAALREENIYKALSLSVAASFFFGYSILVRSGSLTGVAGAFLIAGLVTFFATGRKAVVLCATALGCALVVAPMYFNCTQKYGHFCALYAPPGVFVEIAQAGLRGARVLWHKKPMVGLGDVPVLPDEFMVENFYNRCRLQTIVGIDTSSLTGCLASRPLALPVYVVKKWIGLFDHFRFTPYLEAVTPQWAMTPPWLRWLSRAYDSLSWVGLALFFLALAQLLRQRSELNLKGMLVNNIAFVLLVTYSMAMLAMHTALHVEDRYGFPVIPLCAVVLAIYAERTVAKFRTSGWRSVVPLGLYCALAWAIFITQIVLWDRTSYY